MKLPKRVNILGVVYKIEYTKDILEGDAVGAIDYVDRTITIRNSGDAVDVWGTIMHEVLHGVVHGAGAPLHLKMKHEDLDRLAVVLADTLIRNGWVKP